MTVDTKAIGILVVQYILGHAGFISSTVVPTLGPKEYNRNYFALSGAPGLIFQYS